MMSLVLYYKQDRIIVVYWRGDSQLEHTLQHNKEKTKITIDKIAVLHNIDGATYQQHNIRSIRQTTIKLDIKRRG